MRFAWIDERPFGYLDDDGKPTGCDIALARAAFSEIGEPFEPVHTTFSELLPGLLDGRWEVTTGMFITAERSRRAHFTRPIWTLRDGLLVRVEPEETTSRGSTSAQAVLGYRSLAVSGDRVAVLRDQVQVSHALDNGILSEQLVVLDTYEQARAALLAGDVDAYASVALAHQQHLSAHPGQGLRCVVVGDEETPPAVGGFACADPAVATALDAAMKGLLPAGAPGEPSADPGCWPVPRVRAVERGGGPR
ncbi:polar amino acid transport system substrate-binding protein [Quadrisphaera granulorum]|uniref:Polar amino acid transport system substrate-binding protein n=1 Tax=Quadrisphaera granulorum TaxID=317664 RepID=A0A315ZRW3_9ACTN|nr:transporter substrate-binding domain-containing protein [Quadrisphaera granulorum]PWJ47618.1 polar amino acid transport system substrate-binding protein [Quadrisphaera granulorum]SZE98748.1 polar amino acid transport system substrate-binding protein [Quadrisphaera granulorum]